MPVFFRTARGLLLLGLLWFAVTLLIAAGLAGRQLFSEPALQFLLLVHLPWYFLLLLLCGCAFFICRYTPLSHTRLSRLALVHTTSALVVLGIWYALGFHWAHAVGLPLNNTGEHFAGSRHLPVAAALYLLWLIVHYTSLATDTREQESSSELSKRLLISEVELQAVKAAVHPHFMYNSLAMLASLAETSPEKIHDLCVRMSDFLRYSVTYSQQNRVTVADEVRHMQNYLDIEKERFGEKLDVSCTVDKRAENLPVIPLLLFPLAENAIKHGLGSQLGKGRIELNIQLNGAQLEIVVSNSFDPDGVKPAGTGHGLSSLQKRLAGHYGHQARLITRKSADRFTVIASLPAGESVA